MIMIGHKSNRLTSLGIDNTGDLVFSYGKEDVDTYDDIPSKEVFRVSDSRFFCKLRDLFHDEMQTLYKDRETVNAWNAETLIKQWDDAQSQFPEELWKVDFERKYKRPYLGTSVDNSISKGVDKGYLIGKFFGRKKYQRRMFETNQEIYYATRFFGNKVKNDQIWFRGNKAPDGATIKQNYSLTITPYSDMYVCVQYTSTGTPIHKRMKAGETYTFVNNSESMDFMYIYAASYIQEIGDLSRCYIDDNSFTAGVRLRRLTIGNNANGYNNPFMTILAADNNPLLEYLDLRNISGLNSILSLSSCGNLKELYAEGTNVAGAIFANGGLLETAHLPAVNSLLMKNLNHLIDLQIAGYNNLKSLTIENCPTVNSYNIVNSSVNLQELRLVGINWDASYNIVDTSILDRALKMWGRDGSNNPVDTAVLTGYIYTAVIKEKDLENYEKLWSDLDIEYGSMKKQFPAVFKNVDGEILEIQYVEMGQVPEDPVTRENNPIERPSITPTVSHEFTYVGWDRAFTKIESEQIYTAVYEQAPRNYKVTYLVNGKQYGDVITAPYGSVVECTETAIPVYTDEEGAFKYSLFAGWDKSGYVDGNKTINAVFDTCQYSAGYFDNLSFDKMSPVEKYAFIKLGFASSTYSYITTEAPFTFTMGNDFDFEDVESNVFIEEETVFTGSNYIDTGVAIMDIDKSFVFAVDYEFDSSSSNESALVHCYLPLNSDGFKLSYNKSNPYVNWGNKSAQCAESSNREMLVIRHTAGDKKAYIYISNLSDLEIGYIELERDRIMTTDSTLTFGCVKQPDGYENYAKGKIYWAKVWYSDLGDRVCREIASYTREEISSMMAGFQRKYLSDGSGKRNSLTFLATHPLRTKQNISKSNVLESANIGGYGQSHVNEWLNTRVYNGAPLWMKQLIKEVRVNYSSGGKVNSVSNVNCYFYLPAIIELNSDINGEPYYNEETASNRTIPYMVFPEDRIIKDHTNTAVDYPTRSAVVDNSKYYYGIRANGSAYATLSPTSSSKWPLVIEWCM